MANKTVYAAGESSKRIVARLTRANLVTLIVVLLVVLVFLNLFTVRESYQRIDAELDRQLVGFTHTHLNPEQHSDRLPQGLLPIIYFQDTTEGYINPHPSNLMIPEDIDVILSSDLPDGTSTQSVNERAYRVYRVVYETPLTFWENEQRYSVDETVSLQDITSQTSMLSSLALNSLVCLLISSALFGAVSYLQARKTIIPIKDAWDKQRQFVADTSHELRNPLTIIQTNAELLLQHPSRTVEEESGRVSAILDGSSRMSSMLATLLTLARADADQDEVAYEHVDLTDELNRVTEQYRQVAEINGLSFATEIQEGLTLRGDRGRLNELFSLLLDNAIRYTPSGKGITVLAQKGNSGIEVTVKDEGIGIPASDLGYVFQRFYRNDQARSMNPDGTGLGLAIGQWIASRHRGELTVSSVEGKGTEVTFSVPGN